MALLLAMHILFNGKRIKTKRHYQVHLEDEIFYLTTGGNHLVCSFREPSRVDIVVVISTMTLLKMILEKIPVKKLSSSFIIKRGEIKDLELLQTGYR